MSYSSQHHGGYPTGYTIHQPIEDSSEDSGEDSGDYSCYDSEEYSDEDRERYLGDPLRDYPLNPLDEPSVDAPVNYYINDPPEQSIEDPSRYLDRVSEAVQAQGSYQTAATAPATQAFRSPGLTSFAAQPSPSQPDATPQAAGAERGDHERPAFPHPDSNPYGPVAQNITGFEPPGFEPRYLLADDWWLSMSIANNYDLEHVARTLQRTTESVIDYVRAHNITWTQEQNEMLITMNVGVRSDMSYVRQHLSGSVDRYDSEILARAKYLKSLAETPQPGSQQYPAGPQSAGPVAPRATRSNKPWEQHELRMLQEFVNQHGSEWHKMRENEIPGRSRAACANKWRDLLKHGQRHLEPQKPEDAGDQEALTDRDLAFIKLRLADDGLMKVIVNSNYRGFRPRTIIKVLYFQERWGPWTPEEDEELLRFGTLSPRGEEWSETSNEPPRPSRSGEEIEARLEYVRKVEKGELPKRKRAPAYDFDQVDNEYLMVECAKGTTWAQMCEVEFPDLISTSLRHHAERIGAIWKAADDERLLNEHLEPGEIPDYASIGQMCNPPRRADLVRARWDHVHSESYKGPSRRQHRH